MEFVYKIKDPQGRIMESVGQAESSAILKTRLTSRGFDVIDIQSRKQPFSLTRSIEDFLGLFETITLKDQVVFSRQFAAMIFIRRRAIAHFDHHCRSVQKQKNESHSR